MKPFFRFMILGLSLITAAIISSGQENPSLRKPIQVSVRILDGNRFVDTLSLTDLEIFENGVPQKIRGLFLIDRGRVIRSEGDPSSAPKPGRHFLIYFQITDFDPKIEAAFKYLFNDVLTENDGLTIVTPMKPYVLTPQAFKERPKSTLVKDLLKLVRKDIIEGASDYRSINNDLKRIARTIGGGQGRSGDLESEGDPSAGDFGLEFLVPRYRQALSKLESLRFADEAKFLAVAENLRRATELTQVIFFYQREFRPEISPTVLSQLMLANQDRPDIQANLSEVFQFYKRELSFNIDRIGKALADAGAPFFTLFLNRQPKKVYGITMTEQSEDIYRIFTEITRTTGGALDISENPAASLQKVAALGASSYLLNYISENPLMDGSYRVITVRVKDKPLTVVHREGYYAR